MSTRGCIARATDTGWRGRYQHFDSYPEGLGEEIWRVLHARFGGDAEAFLRYAVDQHPGGWSSFPKQCYCHDPAFVARDGSAVDDPEQVSDIHEHGGRCTPDCDPLFIEYVYALSPTTLFVYAHRSMPAQLYRADSAARPGHAHIARPDGYVDYGHCAYRHVLLGAFALRGAEPSWSELSNREEE